MQQGASTRESLRPGLTRQVYAAGSLRDALTEIARDHEARTGQKVVLTFAASGLLRERIEQGAPAQVFASADTKHPQRLANQGSGKPRRFHAQHASARWRRGRWRDL